ncbi:MAG: hypothetical protein LBO64_01025 [Desulfovibrio sp.]|nr:hypothetical protein [Desulfovibrio sp.]
MPEARRQFQESVTHILEAVMFENWLRFYFIAEKSGAQADGDGRESLVLAVPDKGMERIKEKYPHLLPLAEAMNGQDLDFEASRKAVCLFVIERLDGTVMPRDSAAGIFESATFQSRMQLFNIWVQTHEDALDRTFLDFAAWRGLFAEWLKSDGARALSEKLLCSVPVAAGSALDLPKS